MKPAAHLKKRARFRQRRPGSAPGARRRGHGDHTVARAPPGGIGERYNRRARTSTCLSCFDRPDRDARATLPEHVPTHPRPRLCGRDAGERAGGRAAPGRGNDTGCGRRRHRGIAAGEPPAGLGSHAPGSPRRSRGAARCGVAGAAPSAFLSGIALDIGSWLAQTSYIRGRLIEAQEVADECAALAARDRRAFPSSHARADVGADRHHLRRRPPRHARRPSSAVRGRTGSSSSHPAPSNDRALELRRQRSRERRQCATADRRRPEGFSRRTMHPMRHRVRQSSN